MGPMILLSGFLTLCSTCGPDVHPATTRAIIAVESSGNPLAIYDNVGKTSYKPANKEEAVRIATKLIGQGHSVDVGLMQINSQHLRTKDLNLTMLFEPCYNIKTGTKILSDAYEVYRRNNPQEPDDIILLKALSSYNTGTPYRGKEYVNKILARATGIKGPPGKAPLFEQFKNIPIIRSVRNTTFFRKEVTQ
jgi:type IV secretion system protein VirB1